MKTSRARFKARFRDVGSLIAGVLIGLSLVAIVFAMLAVGTSHLQMFLAVGALIALVLGLMLQFVINTTLQRLTNKNVAHIPKYGLHREPRALLCTSPSAGYELIAAAPAR